MDELHQKQQVVLAKFVRKKELTIHQLEELKIPETIKTNKKKRKHKIKKKRKR